MKAKKRTLILLSSLLLAGALASCADDAPMLPSDPAPTTTSEPPASIQIEDRYTEIATIDIDSGEYMIGNTVYVFNKEQKKMKATSYEDYASYQEGKGTQLFEVAVTFVKVTPAIGEEYQAVRFKNDGADYSFYRSGKYYRLNTVTLTTSATVTTFTAVPVGDILPFTYGKYVSDLQTQNKVDAEGKYIYDSQGASVKEEFYLFLELSKEKAAIYVGHDATSHDEKPLHSIENYKIYFATGRLVIRIPHANGQFNCTLNPKTETTISFNNSMETRGDYSASGTFTKIG